MVNQRRYPRAPLSGTVKFFDWNRPMHGEPTEISGEGMFLKTPDALPEGTMLTLRLALPGLAQAFTVLGRVVHTVRGGLFRPPGMGIRFVDIPAGARRSILDYVSRRTLRPA